jgi:uncharacterized Zn finger protein
VEIGRVGIIEYIDYSSSKIVAKISLPGKSSKRTVELRSTANGLEYKCTCSNKPEWFCKHCVAVALDSWKRAAGDK